MGVIENFCDDAVEIMIRYRSIVKRGKRFNFSSLPVDSVEVFRSLWYNDHSKLLFPIDIDFHEKEPRDALKFALAVARKIESRYPQKFLWTYSGRGIHGQTLLHEAMTPEFASLRERYGDVQILKAMAQNISKDTIGVDLDIYNSRTVWRSVGSINFRTMTYNVPICLKMSVDEIIKMSRKPPEKYELPVWDGLLPVEGIKKVKLPSRCRVVPDGRKTVSPPFFPPCIKLILQATKINFARRKVLLSYLRDVGYSVTEIYKILEQQYGIDKMNHVLRGREVERFFDAGYPVPSCSYIKKLGLCSGCDRTHPLQIDFEVGD